MKGIRFFTFKEDILHHIDDVMVIISTRSSILFYHHSYFKTWLTSLKTYHQPIYWLQLAQISFCVIDITQQVVSPLMCG